MTAHVAATVAGEAVTIADVDDRERAVRGRAAEHALPPPGTAEARQLRRWLTQVLVAERVVAREAAGLGGDAPTEVELLPDTVARMEIGSVAAATLATSKGRAVFARVTARVQVGDEEVAGYHARNPSRFARVAVPDGDWHRTVVPDLDDVRPRILAHLVAAARRRAYRRWLDARCAELVVLAPGYEHPGDPCQPDNTHTH